MAVISAKDLENAVEDLSMLEYFPREPGAQAAIMRLLAKMCPNRAALRWLVDTMVNRIGKWHGPMELRGVLCWKFAPLDGIDASCSIAGFTPEDGERRALESHDQLKAGGWLGAPDRGPGKLTKAGDPVRALLAEFCDDPERVQ